MLEKRKLNAVSNSAAALLPDSGTVKAHGDGFSQKPECEQMGGHSYAGHAGKS